MKANKRTELGTWGALNTATPQKKINDHRKKSPRNTVAATIIFSYIILTYT